MNRRDGLGACLVWLTTVAAVQAVQAQELNLDTPRPIEAVDSVFIEDLTWMEVRDAIAGGKTTALVATGGMEQNGPYVVTGKHNVVLRATTEAIARRMEDTLVAPIIKLVPEGRIDPPSGHMRFPGTISLGQETFRGRDDAVRQIEVLLNDDRQSAAVAVLAPRRCGK